MTSEPEPGLRERKRVATRRAIRNAALQLAVDRGLDGMTVEEISRVADVSPRTFFNYFPSKEAALLDDGPKLPDDDTVEAFVTAHGDIIDDLGLLLSHAADVSTADRESLALRRDLVKQHPHLLALRMAGMHQFEARLGEIISRRLSSTDPALAESPEQLGNRSRLLTLVAFAALRHSWGMWAADETATLAECVRQSFRDLHDIAASTSGIVNA